MIQFTLGLHWWCSGKRICLQCRRHGFYPLDREDLLEKEMATCYSILAWKIPWIKELNGLQLQNGQIQLSNQITKNNIVYT